MRVSLCYVMLNWWDYVVVVVVVGKQLTIVLSHHHAYQTPDIQNTKKLGWLVVDNNNKFFSLFSRPSSSLPLSSSSTTILAKKKIIFHCYSIEDQQLLLEKSSTKCHIIDMMWPTITNTMTFIAIFFFKHSKCIHKERSGKRIQPPTQQVDNRFRFFSTKKKSYDRWWLSGWWFRVWT